MPTGQLNRTSNVGQTVQPLTSPAIICLVRIAQMRLAAISVLTRSNSRRGTRIVSNDSGQSSWIAAIVSTLSKRGFLVVRSVLLTPIIRSASGRRFITSWALGAAVDTSINPAALARFHLECDRQARRRRYIYWWVCRVLSLCIHDGLV